MSQSAPTDIDIGRFYTPQPVHATKHVITFYNGSNLFFGHVKTDSDLLQYQGAEFVFIGWEELTQFTYCQWDFLKGSNRCPIKTYWHKGCEYAVRPRMAAGTNPNGIGSGWVKALWIKIGPGFELPKAPISKLSNLIEFRRVC